MKNAIIDARPGPRARAKRVSGFATMTAICLIALTGIAITALASLFSLEMQRTREGAVEAQLRQLLLAAMRMPPPAEGRAIEMSLPPELVLHGASLRLQRMASAKGHDEITVHVEARWDGHLGRETLVYQQTGAGLVLQEARLDD
jgi:hypothetical protein